MTAIDERELVRAVTRAMENAGTLPAKDSVKLVPEDWHRICDLVLDRQTALRPGSTGETEGWQPIETFDGSEAYVLVFDGSFVSEARYQPSEKGWWLANMHPTDAYYDGQAYPTHWRRLPSPPSAMLAAAGGRDEP